jgi:SET domain-containing protein
MRRRFTPGGYALRVGRSQTGRGVFALEPIPKGACVIEYIGRPVSEKEQYENRGKYLFWTGRGSMIDGNVPGNTAKYINHSCAPNCEIDLKTKRIYIFALRKIKAGEELTYDYDTEYFDEHIKPRGCRCSKCATKARA